MIFWIFVILTIVSIAVLKATSVIAGKNFDKENNSKFVEFVYHNDESIYWTFGTTALVAGLTMATMLIMIIISNVSASGTKAKLEQTYNALIYKSQTESIRDEFGIVNKEYIDEVQSWNEEISKCKTYSNNFWIGIFYPKKVYQDLKLIDLEEIKMRE